MSLVGAHALAGRGKKKPVHKDAFALHIRVVGKQAVPFVLLLTCAVVVASFRLYGSVGKKEILL